MIPKNIAKKTYSWIKFGKESTISTPCNALPCVHLLSLCAPIWEYLIEISEKKIRKSEEETTKICDKSNK